MSATVNPARELSPHQRALRDKCFHPTGRFVEFPRQEIEQSLPQRIEKIVRMYPERVAVRTRERTLTYSKLNHAANRLAQAILARRGPAREPIALVFSNEASLIVAIVGSLKAGKICMPLDPTLPHARLSYMVEDAQAGALVTSHEYRAIADDLVRHRPCIDIDELAPDTSSEDPDLTLAPDDYAHIFYTSGSTGTPKGIVENHHNLLHHIMCDTNNFHICAEDRIALLSHAGRDIFRALLNGAALYPIDVKRQSVTELTNWLLLEKITFVTAVVSLYRHIVDALTGAEQFPDLRVIKLIGESVYRSDVERYHKHFSARCVLVNSYGPNETGGLSHYLIDKNTQIADSMVPVGYAVEDKRIVILDEDGQELGFDTVGEIAVWSHYLSPGYWRRPDLTRAAFFSSSQSAERLYRTGDLGSMQPDGRLIHLGRRDSQVKIRGHRVEIAEVEMALLQLDAIKEAAVVAHKESPGFKRLVAYIVPRSAAPTTASALRSQLAAKLPDYMIPSAFVTLANIPLTATGKVDRRALPAPGSARPELNTRYVAARTQVEEEVAKIWSQVLSIDRVGIYDSFFDLGGNSISATQIVSQLYKQFRLEIPLNSLFESPTVAAMAVVVAAHQTKDLAEPELARILAELESMPEEKARQLLAHRTKMNTTGKPNE
jgi:amino acid adenylation domain-containing protein